MVQTASSLILKKEGVIFHAPLALNQPIIITGLLHSSGVMVNNSLAISGYLAMNKKFIFSQGFLCRDIGISYQFQHLWPLRSDHGK